MLSRKVLFVTLVIIGFTGAAQAQDPFQDMGRYLGFGWGDGYNSNRTWPLGGESHCNCRQVAPKQMPPTPAAKPAVGPQQPEPSSPSDKPVLKTGRRYPTQNGQQRR